MRPTSDRVREAIFDVLVSLVDLEGANVADLFAGTGAMGIEALSRGAGSVTFVDREAQAIEAVSANLRSAGLSGSHVNLVRSDVLQWLSRRKHTAAAGSAPGEGAEGGQGGDGGDGGDGGEGTFDLAFADPPYAFEAWDELLRLLRASVAVLESDRPVEPPPNFDVIKTKRYGSTLVTVVRAAGVTPK